jgi:hypothetical protein
MTHFKLIPQTHWTAHTTRGQECGVVRGAVQHMECDTQRIEQLCSGARTRWLALLTIRQPMQPSGYERACRQHQTPLRADSDKRPRTAAELVGNTPHPRDQNELAQQNE